MNNNKIIIALSGKKGSGKNTIASVVKNFFKEAVVEYYSFADTLKEFCIQTLGLLRHQCYGTDEEKNSPTKYLWEQVSDPYLRWKFGGYQNEKYFRGRLIRTWKDYSSTSNEEDRQTFWLYVHGGGRQTPVLKTGPITGREIMQLFGTDLIRDTFGNIWADATIRRINKSSHKVFVITDLRFPNEVDSVLSQPGGFIIRLTRSLFNDSHSSEIALDNFNWEKNHCFILDNTKMDIETQCKAMHSILENIPINELKLNEDIIKRLHHAGFDAVSGSWWPI